MRTRLIGGLVGLWALVGASAAYGQCGATLPGGTLSGNLGTSQGPCQPLTNPVLGRNGVVGGSVTLRGSTSGSAIVSVPAAAGNVTFQLPATNGANANVLITDGAGHTSWSSAGSGTVSSVGLSMPGIFTVTNSPVTSTGTLTATLNTQSANLVWAGPSSGAAATPTFRSLVGADLPNPTTSSLGGVQAIASVSHQWVNSINNSGVPQLSQPAFSDLSGSLSPSQCPNPSSSTIGCVQSFAAVPHQWINQISTSGVISGSQPNFTDLVGSTTLAQLPSISNNSILGNNSGGTAVPSTLSASNVLDMINNVQGDILYRNATGWVVLAPGTNGQVLSTGGSAANPSWTTVTGTGTVTSIATGTGLTGGTITSSGTISLAPISTGNVLANVSGISAAPTPTTPSAVLDVIGSATGDILYRSSGGWSVLAPGTNGQVLTQGTSTPAWSNAGTLTNVTISAGNGISPTGTCNITTSGTCTVSLSLGNQILNGAPGNATGSSSTSGVMMGYGSTCHITPAYSTRVRVTFDGAVVGSAANSGNILVRWANGASPPTNGTAPAGAAIGASPAITYSTGFTLVSYSRIITGVSAGTNMWADLDLIAASGTTMTLFGVNCTIEEID